MDPMIEQTINGFLTAFDSVAITDDGLKAEIEEYKSELRALGEQSSDPMDFMNKMNESGMNEKQSALLAKAYAPPSDDNTAQTAQQDTSQSGQQNLPSVSEYLDMQKPSYDAAKAHGYQPTAVAAYEEFFSVRERTDDLLEMHIILEEEGLNFKPAKAAFYDVNKLTYDSQDPNNEATKAQFKGLMELGQNVGTQEELDYKNDRLIAENQQRSFRFNYERIAYPATVSKYILDYLMLKFNIWGDNKIEDMVPAFVRHRAALRQFFPKCKELLGLDLEDLIAHPHSRKYLLAASAVDALHLGWEGLDDEVLELWREIRDEVLSDKTEEEILSTVPDNPMYWGLDKRMPDQKAASERMHQRAEEILSSRYYYNYFKKVGVPDLSSYEV